MKNKKRSWKLKSLVAVIILFVGARIALPFVARVEINKILSEIPGYYGHVDEVHIALWRGAYEIIGIKFIKNNGPESEPLFAADKVGVSLDWHALFQGKFVSRVYGEHPVLLFVQRRTPETSQTSVDTSWQVKIQKFCPIQLNDLTINDGVIRYKDETFNPPLDVYINNLNLDAHNLSNAQHSDLELPSIFWVHANVMKSGAMDGQAKVNVLADPVEAQVKLAVQNVDLRELDLFSKAYGHFDLRGGNFHATMEVAASKTRVEGYIKTLLTNVRILDPKADAREHASVGHRLWEDIVAALTDIFTNPKKDQFAVRIPISGSRKDLSIERWPAFKSVVRNAFVQAMKPNFENNVNFADLVGISGKKPESIQPQRKQ